MTGKLVRWAIGILCLITPLLFSGSNLFAAADIVIAVPDNFISMDPHDTNDTLGYSAQKSMLQGLVGFDKDMNVVPLLAQSYTANATATEFTFHLRKGITFHDGTDFDAQAVKINVERLADPANKLKRHSLFALVSEVKVIDKYRAKVILREPFGAMINNFAHPSALMHSPKALARYGKEVSRHPVGTGPFKFQAWVPGDHLKVVKHATYWRKGWPKVDSITFKPTPENGSRIAMLKTGEADFIFPVPPEQAPTFKHNNNLVLEAKPSIIVRYIAMNNYFKPFNDIRVRKAMNYGINRKAFKKVVLRGFMDEIDSIIAPNVQHYAKQAPYRYDPDKARKLLKEAGYGNGFKIEIWGNNNSDSIKGMEFIQQQLAMLNIKVSVIPMESGTRAQRIWSVKNPQDARIRFFYAGWSPSTGDADWGIRPLFAGFSFPPNSYNTAYYSNPGVDKLIKDAIATADQNKRKAFYAQIQTMIWDECPWVFLGVSRTMAGRRTNLQGVHRLADGSLSVEYAERTN